MSNIEEKNQAKKDKSEKISKFAEVLSSLRKERGISQKKASCDLGISQALLSHYEKGIRECGLDFVIKCSEYYGVTTDYLLGVSDNRNGLSLACEIGEENEDGFSVASLANATKFLIDIVASAMDKNTAKYIYNYYTLCLYRGAITMAKAGILPTEMFKIDINLGRELANAAIAVEDAKFCFIEDKSRTGADFSQRTALHTIIEKAEESIISSFIIE